MIKYITILVGLLLLGGCEPTAVYTTQGLLIGANCGPKIMGRYGVDYDSGCVIAVKTDKGVSTYPVGSDSSDSIGQPVVVIDTGKGTYRVIKSIE
ncbi:hypothetical protein D3C87_954610 [compost metagenome]